MSLAFVVATLVLHPVLDEAGPVRLVATGLDDELVLWRVDGRAVGTTADGEAMVLMLSEGAHRIEAQSAATGAWQALARSDPQEAGWSAVPAWHGERPAVQPIPGESTLALGAALAGAALWARRRLLSP
ncbi:MAG: hypothetical protein AABX89_07910 [Candidatus Thermoplasmatota archaeon]